MRCRQCDYALWNLATRQCPECGAPFKPSDYTFVCNSVRFCCPQCEIAYYGTAANGHLAPPEFDCVGCGRHLVMDEMILRPAVGVDDGQTQVDSHPWIERPRGRWLGPWLRTVGRSMVMPLSLIRAVPLEHPPGRAWAFALLTIAAIFFVGAGVPFTVLAIGVAIAGDDEWPGFLAAAAGCTLVGPLIFAVLIALWGVCTHAVLKLSGGAPHSIGRTYHALCYSAGANVTTAAPCVGVYPFLFVGLCWWLVSAVLMVGAAHRIHGGRAAAATLAFPGLLVAVLFVGGFGLALWGAGQSAQLQAVAVAARQEAECASVLGEITDHARRRGAWPGHALALATGGAMSESDFIAADTLTFESGVSVGDATLEDLAMMPPGRRAEAIEAIVAGQPEGLVAHRLGDYVFTYHGLPTAPEEADGELWLVVQSPDPEANLIASADPVIVVGKLDGLVRTIRIADLPTELQRQNERRAELGLAPLPDPATVTHAQPARE